MIRNLGPGVPRGGGGGGWGVRSGAGGGGGGGGGGARWPARRLHAQAGFASLISRAPKYHGCPLIARGLGRGFLGSIERKSLISRKSSTETSSVRLSMKGLKY